MQLTFHLLLIDALLEWLDKSSKMKMFAN